MATEETEFHYHHRRRCRRHRHHRPVFVATSHDNCFLKNVLSRVDGGGGIWVDGGGGI